MVAQRGRGQERSAVPPIQDLIPPEGERSLADLEDLSGGEIKRAQWGKWRNGQMLNFPEPATIQAIAQALNLNVTLVVLACAKTLGLDVTTHRNRLENLLPPRAADLTDRQIEAVVSVVDAIVTANDRPRRGTDDGPGLRAVARKRGTKRGR